MVLWALITCFVLKKGHTQAPFVYLNLFEYQVQLYNKQTRKGKNPQSDFCISNNLFVARCWGKKYLKIFQKFPKK